MRVLVVVLGTILALLLAWATMLGSGLPQNQAIGFAIFGACVAGLLAFTFVVSQRNKGHDHD